MNTGVKYLNWLEDELAKVEREREVGWRQWLALARVVYYLLREKVKHDENRAD